MICIYNEIKSEVILQSRVTKTIMGSKTNLPIPNVGCAKSWNRHGAESWNRYTYDNESQIKEKLRVGILIQNHTGFVNVNNLGMIIA